ncbi:ArgP/LysG family DNA-binding transcriptional regulator [Endozoicomonas acroporae]|uniref:ArgP/LysG family DNA-binding transcriptional regulator n=1 Tax=Endozoicomonas acroporae TaxID=1701104 RepID=UPI003D7B8C61
MFDYRLLEALERVGEFASFERAAQRLGITQSAISQRISTLEHRVGKLLVRRGRPIELTEAGVQLANHLSRVKLLETDLSEIYSADNLNSSMKIAVNADSIATWWFQVLATFLQNENLTLGVVIEDQSEGLKHLSEGQVVGCLCSSDTTLSGSRCHYVGSMRYRFYCSQFFYSKHFSSGVTENSLVKAPAVSFGNKDEIHTDALVAMGINCFPNFFTCPSSEGLMNILAAGVGYGVLPELQVMKYPHNHLVDIFPDHPSIMIPLYWHYWREGGQLLERLTNSLVSAKAKRIVEYSDFT